MPPAAKEGALSIKEHEALRALIDGLTIQETAETVGVAETTIYRWSLKPEFQAVLREARIANGEVVRGRLMRFAHEALTVIGNIMNDKDVAPQTRLKAASEIMDRAGLSADLARAELERRQEAEDSFQETFHGTDLNKANADQLVALGEDPDEDAPEARH